jgi:hypothetical protein
MLYEHNNGIIRWTNSGISDRRAVIPIAGLNPLPGRKRISPGESFI